MNVVRYPTKSLRKAFKRRTILTFPMIAEALGSDCRMTLLRKLRELDYQASYSPRGKFYVLNEDACYDHNGLWMHEQKRFSRFGTLGRTLAAMVCHSEDGRLASELRVLTGVPVQETLMSLYRGGTLARVEVGGRYLYVDPKRTNEQRRRRRACRGAYDGQMAENQEAWAEFRAAMPLLLGVLNEKQRRLYLGLESLRLGAEADARVAAVAGVDARTVAKGRRELLAGDVSMDRIRAVGAGRPALKKKRKS